jgi:hypothetical protein
LRRCYPVHPSQIRLRTTGYCCKPMTANGQRRAFVQEMPLPWKWPLTEIVAM